MVLLESLSRFNCSLGDVNKCRRPLDERRELYGDPDTGASSLK
jgi:hypothetical protein